MSVRKQRGFTLVELLVVISIIGMLMALLIPAVQQARETARGNTCRNNLKNLVQAIINYESTTQSYPGYQQTVKSRSGIPMQVSWVASILRQLDRPDIDNTLRGFRGPVDPNKPLVSHPLNVGYCSQPNSDYAPPSFLEILLCPSDAARTKTGQVSHYVVNTGREDDFTFLEAANPKPIDYPDNGIFQAVQNWHNGDYNNPMGTSLFNQSRRIGSGFVSRGDGLTTTLMLSENVDSGDWTDLQEKDVGFVWWGFADPPEGDPTDPTAPALSMAKINGLLGEQNSGDIRYARPSSYHPGGVNVAFAGGNVRFISEEIQYLVYILLMTPNGRGAVDMPSAALGITIPHTPYKATPVQTAGHTLTGSTAFPGAPLNEASIIP